MDIQEWYFPDNKKTRDALHWELFKYLRPRETAFLEKQEDKRDRHKNIGEIGRFKQALGKKYKDTENYWDLYGSVNYLAKTTQTTREKLRQKLENGKSHNEIANQLGTYTKAIETKQEQLQNNKLDQDVYLPSNFQDHWNQHLYEPPAWDIVFDIDGEDEGNTRKEMIQNAYTQAQKITRFLDKYQTPYSVRFSGGKGFHIVIPREKLDRYIDTNYKFKEYAGTFSQFIKQKTGAEFDPAIYTDKRILRVPYSMHSQSKLICMPLTREQFDNGQFDMKYGSPDYIRNNIDLKNRGTQTRTGKANRIIKQFRKWRENNNIELEEMQQTEDSKINTEKIQSLKQRIQNLTPEEQQKLNQEVNL